MLKNSRNNFINGMRDGIPISLGYLAVSFTLGMAAGKIGLNAFQATLMSITNNTSAGEFAALSLIASGGTYLEMAVTQFIVNLRYMLMSCVLSQKLSPEVSIRHRLLLGFDLTDEIFGVSAGVAGSLNPYYTYGAVLVALPGWAMGTCLGLMMGEVLPARLVSALSVALYGMFIAVIVPAARKNKTVAGIIAVAMAASFLAEQISFFAGISSGMKIIILTVVIAGIAAVVFPVEQNQNETGEGADE